MAISQQRAERGKHERTWREQSHHFIIIIINSPIQIQNLLREHSSHTPKSYDNGGGSQPQEVPRPLLRLSSSPFLHPRQILLLRPRLRCRAATTTIVDRDRDASPSRAGSPRLHDQGHHRRRGDPIRPPNPRAQARSRGRRQGARQAKRDRGDAVGVLRGHRADRGGGGGRD